MLISCFTVNTFPITGDLTNELVRHFLIESSPKGVKLKGCPNEPYFGKSDPASRENPPKIGGGAGAQSNAKLQNLNIKSMTSNPAAVMVFDWLNLPSN